MTTRSIWIQAFDPATARAEAMRGFHAVSNCVRAEQWPDDPQRGRTPRHGCARSLQLAPDADKRACDSEKK